MNMLTKQQILLLHTQLIRQSGGTDGVRDEGMLDSAISQPFQTFDNMELYPGIVNKAVRLGYGLITNHPFVDGNKRIGTHAMLVTLDINGIELQYQDEDLIQLILKIASGKADDRVLRTWVLAHIV
ncbi:type II toxin-antitoxin system death-on-curing family toxin [Oribacterium sp. HCP28S3_H8]|uniref:type II toxin-antitoxin system death-on-curing family toxin n=1 Tax=Oribacterium sp. HCP28S3_H8 TaxID=3438945 RepID=UPI003F8A4FBD